MQEKLFNNLKIKKMNTEIKLPELPKNEPFMVSERSKVLEYSLQGTILTEEKVKEHLQKWLDYFFAD